MCSSLLLSVGTSPWHWYATSAIPRLCLGCAVFFPLGVLARRGAAVLALPAPLSVGLDRSLAPFFLPVVAFVAAYSFLPHKELRFLLPAAPLLYLTLAHGLSKVYVPRRGPSLRFSCVQWLARLAPATHTRVFIVAIPGSLSRN